MQFAFVREGRVRRRRRFGVGLLAIMLTAVLAISALAQNISPATKQLFDAVWADDLGRVKAAITAGASISAVNELGVRPVDMAVDRGHYEIAHYLLSVENQRRDAATQEPEPTPAERMVARSVMPAPTSSLPEPGRFRESAVTRQPTPKTVPVEPVTPEAIARLAPGAPPTAQEQLWSPGASAEKSDLQVVSVAEPQPIVTPPPSAEPIKDAPVPQVQPSSEPGSSGQSPGWLNRVTDLFQFSEKETAPTTPASPSNIAAVEPEQPEPKAVATDQPSQNASGPLRNGELNPAAPERQVKPLNSVTFVAPARKTNSLTSSEDPAPTGIGRMFSRITNVFLPSSTADSASNVSDLETNKPVNNLPTASASAPAMATVPDPTTTVLEAAASFKSVTPEVADAVNVEPDNMTVRQIISDAPSDHPNAAVPIVAAPDGGSSDQGVSWLTRLREVFEPPSSGAVTVDAEPTSAPKVIETAAIPEVADEANAELDDKAVGRVTSDTPFDPPSEPVPVTSAPRGVSSSEGTGWLTRLRDAFEPAFVDTAEGDAMLTLTTDADGVSEPTPEPKRLMEPTVEKEAPAITEGALPSPVAKFAKADQKRAFFGQLRAVLTPDVSNMSAQPESSPNSLISEAVAAADAEPNDTTVGQILSDAPSDPPSAPELVPVWPTRLRDSFEPTSMASAERDATLTSKLGGDRTTAPEPEPRSNIAPHTVSTKAIKETAVSQPPVASPPEVIAPPAPPSTTVEASTATSLNKAVVAPPDAEALDADSESPNVFSRLSNLFKGDDTANSQVAAPVKPVTPAANAALRAPLTPHEQLWSPGASAEKSSLQVVGVAKPQPIVTSAPSAGSVKDAPIPAFAAPASPLNVPNEVSGASGSRTATIDQRYQSGSAPSRDKGHNPAVHEGKAEPVKSVTAEAPDNEISVPLPSGPVARPVSSAQVGALPDDSRATLSGNSSGLLSPSRAAAPLADVRLTLSEDQGVGHRMPAPGTEQCVYKTRWNTEYCIESLSWPPNLASAFDVSSNFYRGPKSIVEYVAGRSVQIHVLFKTEEIQRVTKYFTSRYGQPTEKPEIWTDLIGKQKRANLTLRWRARDSKTGEVTVLEIREIDDLRWSSPPDTRHGALRIYAEKRGSVFKLLSWTDLLLVQLRRRR